MAQYQMPAYRSARHHRRHPSYRLFWALIKLKFTSLATGGEAGTFILAEASEEMLFAS